MPEYLGEVNPEALRGMAGRLVEARERGLWRPRLNTAHVHLAELAA